MRVSIVLACGAALLLQGCIARTAASVVTAPVRAAGQVVDWTTTSQDEADRATGRRVREREAQLGRLENQRARAAQRCQQGNAQACDEAGELQRQVNDLRDQPLPH